MKKNWRIIVGILAIIYIAFMWMDKGIVSFEMSIPMFITTLAVSLMKVALIAGVIFLIKYITTKIRK